MNDNHDNENGINDNDAKRVQSCTFTLHAAQEILVAPLWPLKASRPQRHEPGSTSCHAVSILCSRRCSSSKRVPAAMQIATNTIQKLPNPSEAVLVWNSSVSLSLTLSLSAVSVGILLGSARDRRIPHKHGFRRIRQLLFCVCCDLHRDAL